MPVKANNHLSKGYHFEQLALKHLQQSGLQFIDKNIRFPFGELDLIVKEGEVIVFVEVKYRASIAYGGAISAISPHKRKRLEMAAKAWLQSQKTHLKKPCRFDLVAITGKATKLQIDWLKNIFQ